MSDRIHECLINADYRQSCLYLPLFAALVPILPLLFDIGADICRYFGIRADTVCWLGQLDWSRFRRTRCYGNPTCPVSSHARSKSLLRDREPVITVMRKSGAGHWGPIPQRLRLAAVRPSTGIRMPMT